MSSPRPTSTLSSEPSSFRSFCAAPCLPEMRSTVQRWFSVCGVDCGARHRYLPPRHHQLTRKSERATPTRFQPAFLKILSEKIFLAKSSNWPRMVLSLSAVLPVDFCSSLLRRLSCRGLNQRRRTCRRRRHLLRHCRTKCTTHSQPFQSQVRRAQER